MKANRTSQLLLKGALNGAALSLGGALVACLVTQPAYAYVDPSIMTYTIQALAGVAVALSAVLGVVWRRLRKSVYKRFGIDENAGKLVEPPVMAVDPDAPEAGHQFHEAELVAREELALVGSGRPQNVRWLPRFVLAFLVSLCVVYTVGVVAPLELIATGFESFAFGVNSVWVPLTVFAAIVTLVLALLLSCIRGRAFNMVLGCAFAMAVGFYVQGTFMNTDLPVADGSTIDWFQFKTITCITTVVWVMIVGAIVYLARQRFQVLKTCAVIGSVVLIVVQSLGVVSLFSEPVSGDGYNALTGKPYASQEGLYEVSAQSNVIVFILDMFDNDYLAEVLQENPQALDEFQGFTWYQNATGQMIPTRYSVASMLTGKQLTREDAAFSNSLIRSWFREPNLLDAIKAQDYGVQIYSTELSNGLTALTEKADNIQAADFTVSLPTAVSQMWKCALYRDMPWLLKWPFWFYTEDINSAIVADGAGAASSDVPYFTDDVAFYQQLQKGGLQVASDSADAAGAFKFIHLNGAHFPFTMNERAERVRDDQTDQIKQGEGALLIVKEYLQQLRKAGKYDDATIIITADHGRWYLADEIHNPSSPIMLVKTPETPAEAAAPLKVSQAPVGHIDVAPTILAAIGADAGQFGSGVPMYDVPDAPRTRYYDATSVLNGRDYTWIKEWAINGDVRDWASWSKTDQQWPIVSD